LKKFEEKSQLELNPEKIAKTKAEEEIMRKADELSTDNIEKTINTLKVDVGKVLMQLAENLDREVSKYRDIQKAIEIKEDEIKEI
jgi:hypothetical protein